MQGQAARAAQAEVERREALVLKRQQREERQRAKKEAEAFERAERELQRAEDELARDGAAAATQWGEAAEAEALGEVRRSPSRDAASPERVLSPLCAAHS